jgi:hypothetical protein
MKYEIMKTNKVEPDYENIIIGLDIADEGPDSTVATVMAGHRLMFIDRVMGNDTMQVVRFAEETWEKVLRLTDNQHKPVSINADKIGVGKGVVDRLAQKDYPVIGINVGVAAINDDEFANRRIEMGWAIRHLAEALDLSMKPIFHTDPLLLEMLEEDLTIRYKPLPSQRIVMEDKKEFRKRYRRSCDFWDSMMLAVGDIGMVPTVTGIDYIMKQEEKNLTDQLNAVDGEKAEEQLVILSKLFGRGIINEDDFVNERLL